MSKRIFTQDQIDKLLENKNISKCSEKSITYSHKFKIMAIKQYNDEGMTSKQIFEQAGIDLGVIGKNVPVDCIRSWRKIHKAKGIDGLSNENRGKGKGYNKGRPKIRGMTDKEKIKKLELTIAYQKEEIDFLAKLRAKRAE